MLIVHIAILQLTHNECCNLVGNTSLDLVLLLLVAFVSKLADMDIKGSGSTRLNQIWFLVILKGVFWILFLLFYAKLEESMLQRCESIRYSKGELLPLRIGIGYNLFNTVHDRVMIKSL